MSHRHKPKVSPNELKAEIIRQHGTIAAFARKHGKKYGTVVAALKFRRNGSESTKIRALVSA